MKRRSSLLAGWEIATLRCAPFAMTPVCWALLEQNETGKFLRSDQWHRFSQIFVLNLRYLQNLWINQTHIENC